MSASFFKPLTIASPEFRRTAPRNQPLRLPVAAPVAIFASIWLSGCISPGPAGLPPLGPTSFSSPVYLGAGAGGSFLDPEIEGADGIELETDTGVAGNLIVGIDTSQRTSIELQLADLGEAELNTGATIGYQTGSVLLVGRVFGQRTGPNLFAKIGVGSLQSQDSDLPGVNVITNNDFNLSTGLGFEYLWQNGVGLRLEYVGHDTDVQYGGLNFIYHFGSTARNRRAEPLFVEPADQRPVNEPVVVARAPSQPTPTQSVPTRPTVVPRPVPTQSVPVPLEPEPLPSRDVAGPVPIPSVPVPATPPPQSVPPERLESVQQPEIQSPVVSEPVNLEPLPRPQVAEPREPIVVARADTPVTNTVPEFEVALTDDTTEFIEIEEPPVEAAPVTTPEPLVPQPVIDSDADGVFDDVDACAGSPVGLPVGEDGCERYNGLISGVVFNPGASTIAQSSLPQLDGVAIDMDAYPDLRLEMLVQVTSPSREEQLLARRRTLEVFRYLRSKGVNASRLRALPPVVRDSPDESGVIIRSQAAR